MTPSQIVTGARVPKPASIVDVVAIQRGSTDPERVIVLTGHIDSRVTDAMNATADAPGADDDASGVAAVIEAARILSRYKFPATLVYGVLSWSASPGLPAAGYRVHWRDTTEAAWTHARDAGSGNGVTLANVAIDDFAFGVAGVSADGFESPVVFPGAAGAFWAK